MKKWTCLALLYACAGLAGSALASNAPQGTISVQVLGAVRKPGTVILDGKKTLSAAVISAGNFARLANRKHVTVKGKNGAEKVYNAEDIMFGDRADPEISDGDIIEAEWREGTPPEAKSKE